MLKKSYHIMYACNAKEEYVFKSLENLKNVKTALYTIIQVD